MAASRPPSDPARSYESPEAAANTNRPNSHSPPRQESSRARPARMRRPTAQRDHPARPRDRPPRRQRRRRSHPPRTRLQRRGAPNAHPQAASFIRPSVGPHRRLAHGATADTSTRIDVTVSYDSRAPAPSLRSPDAVVRSRSSPGADFAEVFVGAQIALGPNRRTLLIDQPQSTPDRCSVCFVRYKIGFVG